MTKKGWRIRRNETSRGNITFDVTTEDGELIYAGLANILHATKVASIPDLIEAVEASIAFIKPLRRDGRDELMDKLRIALIKSTR